VLIRTVVAPLLATNCHLVLDGGRLWVVDPGAGAAPQVSAFVDAECVVVAGILLTHGHLDHTWDAAELSDRYRVAVHVHADDAYRLADPVRSLGPVGVAVAEMAGIPDGPPTPSRIETFDAVGPAGAPVTTLHCPGHTEGSTVFRVAADDGAVALTGDVLFAGSVGRTDFPGSDPALMATSLARLAALDPATRVLPGHGPASTIAAELATNPFLRRL
jgi:glyoxylase-like metal-dependent hydrolase (beta-lactamase superfamily II)